MKLFAVYADYRGPEYAERHPYYVEAENKRQAKERFRECVSWLKICRIEPVADDVAREIISQPRKHNIWRYLT